MKLTKTQETKLRKELSHVLGTCMCPPDSKTCTYWKNVDSNKPNWQADYIVRLVKKI